MSEFSSQDLYNTLIELEELGIGVDADELYDEFESSGGNPLDWFNKMFPNAD